MKSNQIKNKQDNRVTFGYTDLNTAKISTDIAAGVWNEGIDRFIALMKSYPRFTFLLRIDYEARARARWPFALLGKRLREGRVWREEGAPVLPLSAPLQGATPHTPLLQNRPPLSPVRQVSDNFHANTNPNAFDATSRDFTAYPKRVRPSACCAPPVAAAAQLPSRLSSAHPVRSSPTPLQPLQTPPPPQTQGLQLCGRPHHRRGRAQRGVHLPPGTRACLPACRWPPPQLMPLALASSFLAAVTLALALPLAHAPPSHPPPPHPLALSTHRHPPHPSPGAGARPDGGAVPRRPQHRPRRLQHVSGAPGLPAAALPAAAAARCRCRRPCPLLFEL